MPSRRAILLLALVIVGAVSGAYFGGFLSTATFVNLETEEITFASVTGGGGSLNRNPDFGGELNNHDKYIASYLANADGQPVNVAGVLKLHRCGELAGLATCTPVVPEVKVHVNLISPGGTQTFADSWTTQIGIVTIQEDVWSPVITTGEWIIRHPDGKTVIPSGYVVETTLLAHVIWNHATGPQEDKGWGIVAIDRSLIYSGVGRTFWRGAHGLGDGIYYITGETAQACWEVGYTKDDIKNTGWTLRIFSEAQNRIVLGPISITELQGCVDYVVQSADFAPFKAVLTSNLFNELWPKDFQGVSAIRQGDVARAPTCNVGGISPQSPKQGETITISFECKPATTNETDQIKFIRLSWGYGTIENSVDLPGGSTKHSFIAPQSGLLNVMLTAYSNAGIPSGTGNFVISVDHQPTNPCLGDPAFCNNNEGAGFPLWLILVLVGAGLFLVGILVPMFDTRLKLIIIMSGIILVLVGVVLAVV